MHSLSAGEPLGCADFQIIWGGVGRGQVKERARFGGILLTTALLPVFVFGEGGKAGGRLNSSSPYAQHANE